MTKKKKENSLRPGQGRRQFFSCYDRIKELTERGMNMTLVYEKLTEEGLITTSYAAFYDAMTQRKKKKKNARLVEATGTKPLAESIMAAPKELPLLDQMPSEPPEAPAALSAQQFSISVRPAPAEKPKGRSKRGLQGVLDGNIEAGAQLETQTAPVDDDPEYAEKKKRVTGKKSGKGEE